MRIVHCPTDMLIADFYTKPLQGKQLRLFKNLSLNLEENMSTNHMKATQAQNIKPVSSNPNMIKKCGTMTKLQECVSTNNKRTYKDVLCGRIKE